MKKKYSSDADEGPIINLGEKTNVHTNICVNKEATIW